MQLDLWINQFVQYLRLEKGLSEKSVEAYHLDVLKLKYYLENISSIRESSQLDTNFIEALMDWVRDLELKASTQARTISGMKSFFTFLEREEIIRLQLSQWFEAPQFYRKIPSILSIDDIDKLLQAAHSLTKDQVLNARNATMIEWLYATGMRVSELVELKRINIDFEMGRVRLRGKGKKERIVPIHDRALEAMSHYWSVVSERPIYDSGYAFLNRRGRKISRNMVFIMLKKAAEIAQIPQNVNPHLIRHTFASHLIKAGVDIRMVQLLLGHASILTTEIYTHFDNQQLRETLEQCHPLYLQS